MKARERSGLEHVAHLMARGVEVDWETTSQPGHGSPSGLEGLRVVERISRLARAQRRSIAALTNPPAPGSQHPRNASPASRSDETIRAWGPLELIEKIGEGSYGEVFRAHDPALQTDVALKLWFPLWSASSGADSFLQEARTLAKIRHPNVLNVLGVASHGDRVGMWTELLRGETLEDSLTHRGLFGAGEAALIGAEVCRALAAVHASGIVHRDVKTRNVMRGDGGRIVLMDFGSVARMSDLDASGPSPFLVGTPLAMAPEQLLGQPVGPPADFYALGVMLYRLVSGRYPIEGASIEELGERHARAERTPLRDRRPDLPYDFVRLVERALAPVPTDRFPSAGAFEQTLAEFAGLGGHPPGTSATVGPEPPRSTGRERHAALIPVPLTSFIGRKQDLRKVGRLLRKNALVTLTGPGGCGKTRLGVRVAEDWLRAGDHQAWFVDLTPLEDDSRVLQAITTTLGVQVAPQASAVDAIITLLAGGRNLIVLDNCEHVLPGCRAVLGELLGACPDLVCLATSREALGLDGEQFYPVPPLSYPESVATADVRELAGYEAVQLFLDRARRASPSFRWDRGSAPAIAEICRRLDGIPLAIELAAARVKVLSAGEIVARLDDRFRLLSGGGDTALPRHQTLRATIQWSYEQLPEPEQKLFRLLAVFAGGWTLEAVTFVAGDDADEFAVLDILARLVDKSLVTARRFEGDSTRYAMLETVRQYAEERLRESEEEEGARTRHLAFYLAVAEAAEPMLNGPEQGAWLSRLDLERENLVSAFGWCSRAEVGGDSGLRLVFAVQVYWVSRGLLELGHRLTVEVIDRGGKRERNLPGSQALFAAGNLGYFMGRYHEARGYLEQSLSIVREIGVKDRVARTLLVLGYVCDAEGDPASARACYEEALTLARESGDELRIAHALSSLADSHREAGELDLAEPLYVETLALLRERGDRGNIALGLLNLAIVSIGRGRGEGVREMILEAIAVVAETGSRSSAPSLLDVCAELAAHRREPSRAARWLGASETQREQMGIHREPVDEGLLARLLTTAREALGDEAYAVAERAGRALSFDQALREARVWLASPPGADPEPGPGRPGVGLLHHAW